MISEIFDRKLFLQDQEIKFLEISIELRKLTNKIEEKMKECDKIISDFEKDMEKEMLDDEKKNIKVCK